MGVGRGGCIDLLYRLDVLKQMLFVGGLLPFTTVQIYLGYFQFRH